MVFVNVLFWSELQAETSSCWVDPLKNEFHVSGMDISAAKFVSLISEFRVLQSLATWANMIWLTHAIFHCPKRLLSFFCYPGPHTAIWHLTYLCLNFKSSLCLAWCSIQSPLSGGFTSYFLLPQFKKFSHFKIIFTKGTQVSEDFS